MDAPGPEPLATRRPASRRAAGWTAAIVFALVMLLTYVPDSVGIGRLIVPDGVEYAASAQRLATTGRFDISVGGVDHPSRYPLSFGVLLAPAYWVAPDDLLAGAWICRAIWAAGCATFAYALARRFGASVAACVVVLLNLHPSVLSHAGTVLSDMPSLAALLAIVAIRMNGRALTLPQYAAAGLALGIGVACRSLALAFALPLLIELRHARRPWAGGALLLAPAGVVFIANAIFNRLTFGSFGMNGYIYWCAVPYADLAYVFSIDYAAGQLPAIVRDPGVILPTVVAAVAAIAVRVRDRAIWHDVFWPMLVAAVPVSVLYLCYFYGLQRLYLPLIVCAMSCGGLAIVAFLHRWPIGRWVARIVCAGLLVLTLYDVARVALSGTGATHELIRQMRAALPTRCRIITGIDAVTIERTVTRGTQRQWIAVNRGQEYADKVVIDHRPDLAGIPPPPPFIHLWPQLIAQGGRLAVPETAADDALLDRLAEPAGPPVFVDARTLALHPTLRERLERRFNARPLAAAPDLIEFVPRTAMPSATTMPASRP